MKRALLILAVSAVLAAVLSATAIIYGQDAQAARFPHQHTNDPIGALNQATLNHHEVALDVGVSYESSGLFAMAPVEPMCEDCGGNHPNLYSECSQCQNGTLAACWGPTTYGTGLVSCSCRCGYLGRCIWIRW